MPCARCDRAGSRIDRVETVSARHAWRNTAQTLLLVLALLAIAGMTGYLLLGVDGLKIALLASGVALIIEPTAAARMTLALYRARPIRPAEAPALARLVETLAARAGLPSTPTLHYVPSPVVNAFAVGNRRHAAIALSDGLLRTLSWRELAGALAHEIAHIAANDLRVMGLADYVSRLTHLFSLVGQVVLLLSLPAWLTGTAPVNPWAMLLLIFAPHLALIAQLGLSRVREFDADLGAARLTGDPRGLAQALAKIERVSRSWRAWLMPGWGNPEPSWLRTHPHTEERVARLLALEEDKALHPWEAELPLFPARRLPPPRWRLGGHWR